MFQNSLKCMSLRQISMSVAIFFFLLFNITISEKKKNQSRGCRGGRQLDRWGVETLHHSELDEEGRTCLKCLKYCWIVINLHTFYPLSSVLYLSGKERVPRNRESLIDQWQSKVSTMQGNLLDLTKEGRVMFCISDHSLFHKPTISVSALRASPCLKLCVE